MPRAKEMKWYRERRKNGPCAYCGESKEHLTMDHVIPLSKGGTWRRENIVFCCSKCNLEKGDLSLDEFLVSRFQQQPT
jgi:5-methylcytosine-specific restriction endonuclease McrA